MAPGFQVHVTGLGFEARMTDAALELGLFEFGAGQRRRRNGWLVWPGFECLFQHRIVDDAHGELIGRPLGSGPANQGPGLPSHLGRAAAGLAQRVRWSWLRVPSSSYDKLVTGAGSVELSK